LRSARTLPLRLLALRLLCVALAAAALPAASVARKAGCSLVTCAALLASAAAATAAVARVTAVERLLLLPRLGLQLERQRVLGAVDRRFAPLERVAAVVINEAVTATSAYFYLAVALRGEQRLLLPFRHSRPRLEQLRAPYRAALALLPPDTPPWPSIASSTPS